MFGVVSNAHALVIAVFAHLDEVDLLILTKQVETWSGCLICQGVAIEVYSYESRIQFVDKCFCQLP